MSHARARSSNPADRTLYLAVTDEAHPAYFDSAEGTYLVQDEPLKLVVFDPASEEIQQWID